MRNVNRRAALRSGVFGAASLSAWFGGAANATQTPLSPQPAHFPAKAKRVIQIFLPGGVSHIDTFDPKPVLTKDHGKSYRKGSIFAASRWKHSAGGEAGLEMTDLFPNLRRHADDLCLIRSMYGDKGDHFEATLSIHSGAMVGTLPGIGAWVSYGMGTENANLPSHVVLCDKLPYAGSQSWDSNFLPAYHQGTRIRSGSTPIPNLKPADGTSPQQQARELELLQKWNRQYSESRQADSRLAARSHTFGAAVSLQKTAPEVFDLADESSQTLDLYGVKDGDSSSFAWQCLMARRLSERGVRFVELVDRQNWDAHSRMQSYEKMSRNIDQAIAGLIADLKQRGQLEETLIVCCTEFGRTPYTKESAKDGRSHHKNAFTCWLAGGGVQSGMAYGETDEYGIGIVDRPAHIHDFHATILRLLGFDHERLTYFYNGRDFRLTGLAGNVLEDVIA